MFYFDVDKFMIRSGLLKIMLDQCEIERNPLILNEILLILIDLLRKSDQENLKIEIKNKLNQINGNHAAWLGQNPQILNEIANIVGYRRYYNNADDDIEMEEDLRAEEGVHNPQNIDLINEEEERDERGEEEEEEKEQNNLKRKKKKDKNLDWEKKKKRREKWRNYKREYRERNKRKRENDGNI